MEVNIGRKERKKKKKGKKKKKVKSTTQRENEGGGEEDKMKTERKKKEKRVGIKYLKTKGSTVLGLNPVQSYIGILVTSTTTGHDGSVVSALASQTKGRGSIPS